MLLQSTRSLALGEANPRPCCSPSLSTLWSLTVGMWRQQVSGREPAMGRAAPRTLQVPSSKPGFRGSNVVLYYDEEPPSPNAPTFRSDSPPITQVR